MGERWGGGLDEVSDIHRHLLDLSVVKLLDLAEGAHVLRREEVDGHALTAKAPTAADAVDVVLAVGGQIVVDHKRDLLDVDATREDIGGDEHTRTARSELPHDQLTLLLVQVGVDRRAREIPRMHFLCQPLDLASRVDKDHRLRDRERLIQVAQRVKLPLLTLHHHVELLDAVQGQLVALHQNADRVAHELGRELEHIRGHRRREEADVHRRRQLLEDVVDLILEATAQHLISLVQHEVVDVVHRERAAVDHVKDASGCAHHKLNAAAQLVHVLSDVGAADASHRGDAKVVANRHHHLDNLRGELARRRQDERLAIAVGEVDVLQETDGESGRLSGSRLGLGDRVAHQDERFDRPLLDRRRLLIFIIELCY